MVGLIGGCTVKKPTFMDFIGIWTAEDGCRITLREDSTCVVENLNIGILHGYSKDSFHSFIGKWNVSSVNNTKCEEYNMIVESDSIYLHESFIISGQGLLKHTPPWNFFQYIGDPDDLNEYKFRRDH